MEDDALIRDIVPATRASEPQAQVHILAAIDVLLVKTPGFQEHRFLDEAARRRDRAPLGVAAVRSEGEVFPEMPRHAIVAEDEAHVIVPPRGRIALDVADDARIGELIERAQHRRQPTGRENEIVVEQAEDFGVGDSGRGVVARGVAASGFIQNDTERQVGQSGEILARPVRAEIIDEDDLVLREVHRLPQAVETRASEGQPIEDRDDERDARVGTGLAHTGTTLLSGRAVSS